MAIYLDPETYSRLVEALTSQHDRDAIMIALGEVADLWPADIRPAADDAAPFGDVWP